MPARHAQSVVNVRFGSKAEVKPFHINVGHPRLPMAKPVRSRWRPPFITETACYLEALWVRMIPSPFSLTVRVHFCLWSDVM
jgi:hypothetical protein